MHLKDILSRHSEQLTIVIGNGVNLYGAMDDQSPSWDGILKSIATEVAPELATESVIEGISNTEFFDLLSLRLAKTNKSESSLKTIFSLKLEGLKKRPQHARIVHWATEKKCPILTTNFDRTFSSETNLALKRTVKDRFSRFYPWESRYCDPRVGADSSFVKPSQAFGIWHINGMEKYPDSIRLGLTDYMGSVHRAREWFHRGDDALFSDERAIKNWRGRNTWLDAIFQNDLVVIGLSLDEVEVFLRWVLIERARLFLKFPSHSRRAWYVTKNDISKEGKGIFLKSLGFELVTEESYDDLYSARTWRI